MYTYRIYSPDAVATQPTPTEVTEALTVSGFFQFTRNTPVRDDVTALVPLTDESIVAIHANQCTRIPTPESEESESEEPEVKPEEPELKWSSVRTKYVNFVEDYLTTQIRVRYAMFDRPRNGLSNVIIDSFVPRLLVASKLGVARAKQLANFPATAVTISPWFSKMFGVKQLPPEQMIRFLGYTPADIKALFAKVKAQNWSISFIGYGGTNVNTLHWLKTLAEMTHTVSPFYYLEIFENDNTDISNLLRFPKDPSVPTSRAPQKNKLNLLSGELETLARIKPYYSTQFYIPKKIYYGQTSFVRRVARYHKLTKAEVAAEKNNEYVPRRPVLDDNGNRVIDVIHKGSNHIFYGAPGIETREKLSEVGHFISATHGSNDCSLHLNPSQDTGLQVESYGMIQLGAFFMNQMRMAIGLLETLADENFDPAAKDKSLLDYTFDGVTKKSCDRNYHFQMDFAGNMLDENDARNIQGN